MSGNCRLSCGKVSPRSSNFFKTTLFRSFFIHIYGFVLRWNKQLCIYLSQALLTYDWKFLLTFCIEPITKTQPNKRYNQSTFNHHCCLNVDQLVEYWTIHHQPSTNGREMERLYWSYLKCASLQANPRCKYYQKL